MPTDRDQSARPLAATPAARKQRRYRERKKTGARFAQGEVYGDIVQDLIDHGFLNTKESKNPAKLLDALADLADCFFAGRLTLLSHVETADADHE